MKMLMLLLVTSFSIQSFAKVNEDTALLVAKAYVQALGAKGVDLDDNDLTDDLIDITYCDRRYHCDENYKFMVDEGECAIFVTVSYQGEVIQSSNDWTCVGVPD